MANIQDKETHFTFHSKVGNIGESFYYLPHWYKDAYVLLTRVQGGKPADKKEWLEYLEKRGIKHEFIGGACLIMPESVEDLFLDERTFTGDCEMYVCHKRPDASTVPEVTYTPGEVVFGEEVPAGFLKGLRALDALVFMSDGEGVNMAHKAKEEIIYFVREMTGG